ncbi:hypothetical protein FGO68_gene2079 [Halteria grandinella]|uniref:Uncharacterized protein n=1 Tax=Halteria grandinella TaxID=5974 RepID=A0A8J8T733_HALGN|nr:hypothetical protein FGO68_gene2079 [Halteria grandinella]
MEMQVKRNVKRLEFQGASQQDAICYSERNGMQLHLITIKEYIEAKKAASDGAMEQYKPSANAYENIPVPFNGFIAIGMTLLEIINLKSAKYLQIRDCFKYQLSSLRMLYLGEDSIQRLSFVLLLSTNAPNLVELHGLTITQLTLDKHTISTLPMLSPAPLFPHLAHLSLSLPNNGVLFKFLLRHTFSPVLTQLTLNFAKYWEGGGTIKGDISGVIKRQVKEGGVCEIVNRSMDYGVYKEITGGNPKVIINVPLIIQLS